LIGKRRWEFIEMYGAELTPKQFMEVMAAIISPEHHEELAPGPGPKLTASGRLSWSQLVLVARLSALPDGAVVAPLVSLT
jgi:hypothetical protein